MAINIELTKNHIKEEMERAHAEARELWTDGSDDFYSQMLSVKLSTLNGILNFIRGQEDAQKEEKEVEEYWSQDRRMER